MRILLIGDDDGTAGYVVRGLSKAGHICDRLADGRDGLFHASREDYDVIVADRMLPGLDELSMIFSRFDRRDGGRVPYISARTALGKVGHASGFYTDIADIIRTVSTRPGEDLLEIWRRMVFGIPVTNTDDHLKNHGFIYAGQNLWCISPLFDVSPQP